jgi:hypothetical protein
MAHLFFHLHHLRHPLINLNLRLNPANYLLHLLQLDYSHLLLRPNHLGYLQVLMR